MSHPAVKCVKKVYETYKEGIEHSDGTVLYPKSHEFIAGANLFWGVAKAAEDVRIALNYDTAEFRDFLYSFLKLDREQTVDYHGKTFKGIHIAKTATLYLLEVQGKAMFWSVDECLEAMYEKWPWVGDFFVELRERARNS